MFINDQTHDIEDFLTAVNFVAPKGMQLKYFIIPYAGQNELLTAEATENGFTPTEKRENEVPGVTDTITYQRKDYKDRQSFNDANFNLNAIPNEFPITRAPVQNMQTNMEPMQTDLIAAGANIESPIKGVRVLESSVRSKDIFLTHAVGPLPKFTVLHFTK